MRGWKSKPWYSNKYLKDKLDKAIFGNNDRLLKMIEKKSDFWSYIKNMDLDENFYNHREKQRTLFTKVDIKGCQNEYMSLFYHIRNSLAHGRLTMYANKNKDITFIMEDGKQIGKKEDNMFEVNARIVINKSSLLKIIEILKNLPKVKDYSEDFLLVIKDNKCTKTQIMNELEIDEIIYKDTINKLKCEHKIEFKHNKWCIQNSM